MRRYRLQLTSFEKAAFAYILAVYELTPNVPSSFPSEPGKLSIQLGDLLEKLATAELIGADNPWPAPVAVMGTQGKTTFEPADPPPPGDKE